MDSINNAQCNNADRPNWVIPDIQLGSETALNFGASSGKIEVNKFIMNLNGNVVST